MKITNTLTAIAGCICFVGCIPEEHSYFLSPLDNGSNYYHAIPMVSDSQKVATYASLIFHSGSNNYRGRDYIWAFNGSLHQSYQFGNHLQAFLGSGVALGTYHVAGVDLYAQNNLRDSIALTIQEGNKFFGAYGVHAGMNTVFSFHEGGFEWRVIGWEGSLQREFGDYQSFRKGLPDSLINILARYQTTATLGGTTEFVFKRRRSGLELGFKIAAGGSIMSSRNYRGDQRDQKPFYFSPGFHITKKGYTGFIQANFGQFSDNIQFGMNFQIGQRRPHYR